jgi:hypothetical protein
MNNKPLVDDRYTQLARVLMDAMEQAAGGKGKERHADGERFENQKICVINRWLHGSPIAGPLFQAVKKTVESSRMNYDAAIRELYGAINYVAAGIILLEELREGEKKKRDVDPLQIEMNCLCLDEGLKTIDVNEELRKLYRTKQDQALQSLLDEADKTPDEMAVFEEPLCEDCFHMKLAPSEMPCKKCIDKPFKPHFTLSRRVYNRAGSTESNSRANPQPPMPV